MWGSGKSTIINLLKKELSSSGYRVLTIHSFFGLPLSVKIYETFKLFLTNPLTLFYFMKLLIITRKYADRNNGKINRGLLRTMLKTYIFRQITIKKHSADLVFWEGEFHLLTLMLKNTDAYSEFYSNLRKLFNLSDIEFIVIDINQNIAIDRIHKDKESGTEVRHNIDDKEGLINLLDRTERNQSNLISFLLEFGCAIKQFDSNEDFDILNLLAHIKTKLAL